MKKTKCCQFCKGKVSNRLYSVCKVHDTEKIKNEILGRFVLPEPENIEDVKGKFSGFESKEIYSHTPEKFQELVNKTFPKVLTPQGQARNRGDKMIKLEKKLIDLKKQGNQTVSISYILLWLKILNGKMLVKN